MTIHIAGTASYLPERWMTAAEISAASGVPEQVIVERFGLRGKHIAGSGEHVSDMAAEVGARVLAETGTDAAEVDAVVYFGSTWKDHAVWHAAPRITHLLGARRAFALELDYVSCGTPVALRVCRDLMLAEPHLRRVLAVAACRESHLLDYGNLRSRFAFTFGDGAAAMLLSRDGGQAEVLESDMVTDGSFAHQVRVPAGGSAEPASHDSVSNGRHLLDVADPASMKEGLDRVSLPNFLRVAEGALKRSGLGLGDVSQLCVLHLKRSMHDGLLAALGVPAERALYLDDTGHMSGVDPLLALDRAARAGRLSAGDVVLLLAAGTGYTWAASVIRWA
ncbi:3-oxoacyl-ACP synthase [Nonomuraea africana]|uniref:3-oxoacyl-[acyl-carrier-protein] synthase-3 n=1 Tax=Nonomuraea africana TaxID=46171 RepID=A0ABR9KLU8_9ACTN|nr:3-oxoacyl-ACP synthase [Nonomuraea africana]MBE1562542.1 3-oxoacyl-[acyl-carrier-protein] synthase-3 [Nonomuraea africana]